MADPSKGVGKEKVACEMVQDLWSQVLKLPTARAAGVIRLCSQPRCSNAVKASRRRSEGFNIALHNLRAGTASAC
jgi:hypothetical protein